MNNIHKVDQPENYDRPPVDWEAVLFGPAAVKCVPTHKTLKDFLPEDDGRRFHDMGDFDEDHDDEGTVDAIVGVGDEIRGQ